MVFSHTIVYLILPTSVHMIPKSNQMAKAASLVVFSYTRLKSIKEKKEDMFKT